MNNKTRPYYGASSVSLLIGMALLTISITGALKLMGVSIRAQNDLNTENLVDQVNRIGEIITVHLNRAVATKTPMLKPRAYSCAACKTNPCNAMATSPQTETSA